ncbi:MAG: DUF86 domain-containing protein [Chloroflexi bacterium]|nr:MAG: DUF86 domain-containing protein [Chloroflexota bacterium]
MNKADLIRIRHMLDAGHEINTFTQGYSREDLTTNRMLALSLVKLIEIIGEAAANVSQAGRETCSEIPWPLIVGMRNRLVHGYFNVDLDRVWDTVTYDLPPLLTELEKIISRYVDDNS